MCCCCVCQCESVETKDMKCCLIFPINCGVQAIALFIILIAVAQFVEVFYQLLNDSIDWWYVLVGVLLAIPLIVALAAAVTFFANETDGKRVFLQVGLMLTIISLTLSATWNAVYFWFFYKSDKVTTGNDGVGFLSVTKKQEIVFSLFIAAVLDAFFAYFICVLQQYKEAFRKEDIDQWINQYDEEKALLAGGDDKADDKPADDAAAGDDKPAEGGDGAE